MIVNVPLMIVVGLVMGWLRGPIVLSGPGIYMGHWITIVGGVECAIVFLSFSTSIAETACRIAGGRDRMRPGIASMILSTIFGLVFLGGAIRCAFLLFDLMGRK